MLPEHVRKILIDAAATKDPAKIEEAIQRAKMMAPLKFFLDDDPSLKGRVFCHAPRSHWTGTAKTYKSGYEGKDD